jgi:hypothetical protein
MLKEGSWQEEMVARCRSRLAIQPNLARAILFFSQLPNGELDHAAWHGGCPVLKGEKWAANLWVWNTPRDGFAGRPLNPKPDEVDKRNKVEDEGTVPSPKHQQIKVTFKNSGSTFEEAELYYEEKFWAKLGKNDPPVSVRTYQTHTWYVIVDGEIVKSWTISLENGEKQTFVV